MKISALILPLLLLQDTHSDGHLKCGSQIKWVESLDKAYKIASEKRRLVFWYVPRVEGRHMRKMYVKHLDNYMMTGPFTNPDIVGLISRKFVPIKMQSKGELGIKAPDFMEPGIVFLSPDKKVVHKIASIRTINDDFVYSQILLVLEKNSEFNDVSNETKKADELIKTEDSVTNRLSLCREFIKDGELTKAAEKLRELLKENPKNSHVLYELGRVYRFLRNAGEALKCLQQAKDNTNEKTLIGDINVEEGLVLLKSCRLEESKNKFKSITKDFPESSRIAEALYYLAALEAFSSNEKEAHKLWKSIVENPSKDIHDTPWGWKSASCIVESKDTTIGESALVHYFEELSWLNEKHYTELKDGTSWQRNEKDVQDVIKSAVAFLLSSQQSNGSWNDSRQVFGGKSSLLNVYMAVTSLCASALLEWHEINPKSIDHAITRAKDYILNEKKMARRKSEECYADAFRLVFLSKLYNNLTDKNEKKEIKEFIIKLIKELEKQQQDSGSFRHEYPSSFSTAAVIHSIQLAKESGIEIPQKMLDNAGKALSSCRGKDGTFCYGIGQKGYNVKGAAGRMPLCESALYFTGLGKLEAIEPSLDAFFEHHKLLLLYRKSDNHSDAYMNAGFFYFHDFYFATQAARQLKKDINAKYSKKFLEILLTIPEIDNTFVDAHQLGRAYATSLALLSFKNCIQ